MVRIRVIALSLVGLGLLPMGCSVDDPVAGVRFEGGPRLAGWREVDVPRRSGGVFRAVLYYPAVTPGAGAEFDASGGPYPAVAYGHGFLMSVERYASTLEHLAARGYFVIATRSQGEVFPDAAQYARDLSDCLTYLEARNSDAGSWLFRQVATDRFAMSGHSLGGGASILAAAADPRVRALVTLAAAETVPSAIAQMPNIHVPVRLIAGSADVVVRLELHGLPMYENANAPRQLAVIDGGSHCGFMDELTIGCDVSLISGADQLAITSRLMTEFLDLYLYQGRVTWEAVWGAGYWEDGALDRDSTRIDPGQDTE